ncbi:MAG: trypsin-like peptidase domain-containing protein, partial [Syntrophorhabdaceae bacterium]
TEGDTVIAAGTPLSFETTFTRGIVSAAKRSFPVFQATFIQTDAALSPGNSGGPLLNMKGDVVGINSLKVGGANVEGIGFAVSINDVRSYIERKKTMNDAELSRELARMEKKIEEMSQWRDAGSQKMKDRMVEEQWEYERRRREFVNRVDEANKSLREQKEKEEKRIRDDAERLRAQMKENADMKRKALSDCLERAQSIYLGAWNESCKSFDLGTRCKLPYSHASMLEERHIQARNECFRLYPQ